MLWAITAEADLEALGYISYPEYDESPESLTAGLVPLGPQPSPAVKVGDVVTVTGWAHRVMVDAEYDPRFGGWKRKTYDVRAFPFMDADHNGWLRNVTHFVFLGWTYYRCGVVHAGTPAESNWTGDYEAEPATLEETHRIKVAVIQPIDVHRPALYRQPFRCLPEHITLERSAKND